MRNLTATISAALALTFAGCNKKQESEGVIPPNATFPKIEHKDSPKTQGNGDQNLSSKGSKGKESQPDLEKLFGKITNGGVPILRIGYMPTEVTKQLSSMNEWIRKYAIAQNLQKMGPALCGMGSCDAFVSAKPHLNKLADVDSVFTNPQYFLFKYGSKSRDAFKIKETLDTLASMPESGWVRVSIRNFPKEQSEIVRHKTEGVLFHPGGLPGGVLLCYDPDPAQKEKAKGAVGWGHIEWKTKNEKGESWYVHAVHSEVHGGSPYGRQQWDKMMKDGNVVSCSAYILTTPELKKQWLNRQLAAEKK